MSGHRLLVVEDELNVGSTLVERLQREGFEVVWAESAQSAYAAIQATRFHLSLMDVGLPDGTGFEVAAKLRAVSPSTAIIFLSAFGGAEDRVRGLELGAEDYIVKPFHFKELILRIRNGLKRADHLASVESPQQGVVVGKAQVFLSRFELVAEGEKHSLTHKEAAVLGLLIEKQGQVVSREEILAKGWSDGEFPTTRTIDNFVLRLRKWVEPRPDSPEVIRSIRGVGYQLVLK
jgi:two-component system alkaline phosphatase synthesis response regulator PhoP